MLNSLIVIRQCLLRLMMKNCLESTLKYNEKISTLMNKQFDSEPVYSNSE